MTLPTPTCADCKKTASELPEVVMQAEGDECTPDESAREDGTYNPENGHFLCMSCYINRGMPSSPFGWVCP
jgi:hypothetical protein